ncbi:hypothetical protein [Pseudomonas sp. LB3P58]
MGLKKEDGKQPPEKDKASRELIGLIDANVKHQTRWVRRIPVLIAVIGVLVAVIGLVFSSGWPVSIGLLMFVVGFTSQVVLWYGLHEGKNK